MSARMSAVRTPPAAVPGEPAGEPDWRDRAACRQSGVNPELFFPAKGMNATKAKRVCAGCPVRQTCLDWALQAGERHGIWGGRSPDQRARLRARAAA